jgi:hypothetical protein
MAFWGQIELPNDSKRMVYLFVDVADDSLLRHEDGTAIAFVQPGPVPDGKIENRSVGPVVPNERDTDDRFAPNGSADSFRARVPGLRPFLDSRDIEPEVLADKVGGIPRHLQGAPANDQWQFVCQFGAWEAGHEIADRAECYIYLDSETDQVHFYWDCH